jgi:hypothetical protein
VLLFYKYLSYLHKNKKKKKKNPSFSDFADTQVTTYYEQISSRARKLRSKNWSEEERETRKNQYAK